MCARFSPPSSILQSCIAGLRTCISRRVVNTMTNGPCSIDSSEEVNDDRPDQRPAPFCGGPCCGEPTGFDPHRRAPAVCCSGGRQKNIIHHDEY